MKKEIFGKCIQIISENKCIYDILTSELRHYRDAEQRSIDCQIIFSGELSVSRYSVNPSSHKTFKKGFIADYGVYQVMCSKEDSLIKFEIKIDKVITFKNRVSNFLRTYDNNLYFDIIGQVLHELILVPYAHFIKDLAVVHASAFRIQNSTVLISGTGGVGKTSLELNFCNDLGASFLSDDICLLESSGKIKPNFSYPKIYGYNTFDLVIKKKLLKGRSFLDRLQWYYRYKLFGPNKVRRRVDPVEFYSSPVEYDNKLTHFFLLFKDNSVRTICIEKLSLNDAVNSNIEIMKSEYNIFYNHLAWHKYNCINSSFNEILDLDSVFENWRVALSNALKNVNIYRLRIPENIDHQVLVSDLQKKILNVIE
ncbi:MAG: hypothetical protein NE334_05190 [Lentisphaeraceae bacterium]|nr:hypothetical protein [Lentisphaeraceae bacterium]